MNGIQIFLMMKMKKMNKLLKVNSSCVVYMTAQGQIITEPIDTEAKAVLDWYYRNIPAND